MIRSNEFNRNKFMNNSFGFNQSFESAIKKLPENMLKNNDNYWKANSLSLNQAKDIKSMQSTASATAASKALKPHICTSCQKRFARLVFNYRFVYCRLNSFLEFSNRNVSFAI